jgi:hypothetical protein
MHWSIFYITLFIIIIVILYFIAGQIHTHTQPVGKIYLSTTYSKYVIGEPISFTITNGYNAPIFITNQCPAEPIAVYRQDGNSWKRLHAIADRSTCVNQQTEVKILASSFVMTDLSPWQSLFNQPGNYRLAAVVEGYSSLPYVDIQIITQPVPNIIKKTIVRQQPSTSSQTTINTNNTSTNPTPIPSSVPAKTYTVHVTSAGNYDLTSITMNVGDILQIIYAAPYGDEVITAFTPVSPTTTTLAAIKVDSERVSRTVTMTAPGTWRYKATNHNGNSGVLTVN